ncbi:hypothetical protein DQM68_00430 [Leptospira mayottensis]|uniref:Uncharacterized protein n=2 Tax=Leptospira mayottensis TaxID=1137606 RepID=A0AA87MSR3_9LEPT|nr:hypothetical protein DQM68_00430 [Leptospira mayottensis]AZQ03664.1 hypothetical protein LEP1GSC190_03565 [Leptospira mayottensis 200901116]EKS01172.1 hypothetical protein LEP1GSC125_1200 [Leptospira mayottensis 200901122]AXR65969.1 hypothetical protein DQM28_02060 [Leptospira mayottensis]AXR69655.1 hypothetical protein DPV73_01930 [Leptospira mayottensis]
METRFKIENKKSGILLSFLNEFKKVFGFESYNGDGIDFGNRENTKTSGRTETRNRITQKRNPHTYFVLYRIILGR